jgi:hypothetical protein
VQDDKIVLVIGELDRRARVRAVTHGLRRIGVATRVLAYIWLGLLIPLGGVAAVFYWYN